MPNPLNDNLKDAMQRLPEIVPPPRVWSNVRARVNIRKRLWRQPYVYALAASLPLMAVAYFTTEKLLSTKSDQPMAVAELPVSDAIELREEQTKMFDAVVVSPTVAAVALRLATIDQEVMQAPDEDVDRIKELLEKQRVMAETYRVVQPNYRNQTVPIHRASL